MTFAPGEIGEEVPLSLADTCISYLGTDPYYFVYPWVVGDELYKAYQDPSANCTAPYPYTIQSVDFILYYLFYSGTIYVSVDVEAAAGTSNCPIPGNMMAISPLYELAMDTGLYLVSIPLDTPVVVDGPFFVGLYFGPDGAPENAAVITDNIEAGCASYNDWGEGYVDLDTVYNNYGEKVFLGRLCLYATGTEGGGSQGGLTQGDSQRHRPSQRSATGSQPAPAFQGAAAQR